MLDPALGRRAGAVAARLADAAGGGGLEPRVPVHGDLSPDQVVMAPDGGVVLLDLDRAAWGPRGWDAACWSASLLAGPAPGGRVLGGAAGGGVGVRRGGPAARR